MLSRGQFLRVHCQTDFHHIFAIFIYITKQKTLPKITADQKLMANLKYFIIATLTIGGRFFLLGSRHQERSIPSAMFESSRDPYCLIM